MVGKQRVEGRLLRLSTTILAPRLQMLPRTHHLESNDESSGVSSRGFSIRFGTSTSTASSLA